LNFFLVMNNLKQFDNSNQNYPLVSICMPLYNGAEFLMEALESVSSQTYPKIEVIVSDDNSQDNSIKIAEDFLRSTSFSYKIFPHERYGIAGNWNFSISQSSGKYIKFLFQDDLLEPECVEKMVELAEKDDDIGLVFSPREMFITPGHENNSGCLQVYNYGKDLHKSWSKLTEIQSGENLLADPNFFNNPINKIGEPSNVLIKKEIFEHIGLFDPELRQTLDLDMWFRIMCHYKIGFVDRYLVKFRVHPKQASNKNLGVKNAVDNQMLRGKMLYSSVYKLSDPSIEKKFKAGVQKLMESEMENLFGWIQQLENKVEVAQQETQEELKEVKVKLHQTEKALEQELGLEHSLDSNTGEEKQVQYALIVKNAWYAYQAGELNKMSQLLRKSLEYIVWLPTQVIIDWLDIFAKLASEHSYEFNSYNLINSQEWKILMYNVLKIKDAEEAA